MKNLESLEASLKLIGKPVKPPETLLKLPEASVNHLETILKSPRISPEALLKVSKHIDTYGNALKRFFKRLSNHP